MENDDAGQSFSRKICLQEAQVLSHGFVFIRFLISHFSQKVFLRMECALSRKDKHSDFDGLSVSHPPCIKPVGTHLKA